MTTLRFILICFLVLVGLAVVASAWKPAAQSDGKLPLVWVTGTNPARLDQIETFNQENERYRLGLDLGDGKAQKVILQCSSGVGPDIFDVYDGDQLQTYAEAGVVWDITEKANREGFSAAKDLWPSGESEVTYGGRQYAYPCNIGTNILIYNKNVFDYFKIPYPKDNLTWDEFAELSATVSNVSGAAGANPHAIFAVAGLNWQTLFESLGGQFFSEQGIPVIDHSPELRKAIEMHRDFIFKKRIMAASLELKTMSGQGGWGSGALNQFAGGRFAMIVTGEWALIGLSRTHNQQLKKLQASGMTADEIKNPLERPLRIGCVMLPKFSDRPASYRVRSRSAAINVRSPRREEALAFLKYLASPSYSKLINEACDSLPGNPKYSEIGMAAGDPDLARIQLHETTKRAMSFGYVPRRSPFLSNPEISELIKRQIGRLESDPSLPIESLLQSVQIEADKLIRRNLERNPDLANQYQLAKAQLQAGNTPATSR